LNRRRDCVRFFIPQRGEMIVLDQNHVEQTDPVIFPAAAGNGVFFKPPPAGCGFARVENLRARALDGIHELRGQGRNAGKPLDKIQRDTLGAQNGAGRAGDFQQCFTGAGVFTIAQPFDNFRFSRKFAEGRFGKFDSGDNQRFARAHDGAGREICRNGCQRRRVAAADVLGERGLDGLADFFGG